MPDLATFGKGLANGYPVSAVAGRAEIMRLMEEVFFSFTFGGETLSLAAALATMSKLQREPVVATMRERGMMAQAGVRELLIRHRVEHLLSISGNPTWSFLVFRDVPPYSQWEIKTLFLQEVLARGILTFGTHNISYAHTETDVQRLLAVYDEVFPILRKAVDGPALREYLNCKPLEPLFKIR